MAHLGESKKERIGSIDTSMRGGYTVALNFCLYSGPEVETLKDLALSGIHFSFSLEQFWFCLTGLRKAIYCGAYGKKPKEYTEVFDRFRLLVEELMERQGYGVDAFMLFEGDTKEMAVLFSPDENPKCTQEELAEQINALGQKVYEEEIFKGDTRYCNVTALSGELHGFTGIREGYLQTRKLNDLSFFRMEPGVLTAERVEQSCNGADYRRVVGECRRLQQALDEGDASLCRKRLENLFLKTLKGSCRWTLLQDALSYCKHMLELRCTVRGLAGVDLEALCTPGNYLRIEECAEGLRPVMERLCALTREQGHYQDLMLQAIYYIKLNYARDIALTDVAEYAGVNPNYLSSAFQKEMGVSLREYITAERLTAAKALLTEGELRLADISEAVGIHDVKYFSRIFKKAEGMTPGEYRRRSEK